jgi:hypothetical protein
MTKTLLIIITILLAGCVTSPEKEDNLITIQWDEFLESKEGND